MALQKGINRLGELSAPIAVEQLTMGSCARGPRRMAALTQFAGFAMWDPRSAHSTRRTNSQLLRLSGDPCTSPRICFERGNSPQLRNLVSSVGSLAGLILTFPPGKAWVDISEPRCLPASALRKMRKRSTSLPGGFCCRWNRGSTLRGYCLGVLWTLPATQSSD